MNLSMRSHRHLLIATIVTALLFVVGLAAAQAEARLEITSIDTAAFPEMHVMLLATDGQSQRRPDVGGLLLRENDVPIDGYEIDPEIIAVGRQYFGMTMPNLNAYPVDGRWGLYTSEEKFTLVAIDAYRPPYIPWHLTTQEFFQLVDEHLTDKGVVVINVGRSPSSRALIDAMVTTLQTVFPSVHVMDIPYTLNTMVYATKQPTEMEDLIGNYLALRDDPATHPLLLHAIEQTILYEQPLPAPTVVFTDDKAPVEWVVNRMVLEFMLNGEMEVLR